MVVGSAVGVERPLCATLPVAYVLSLPIAATMLPAADMSARETLSLCAAQVSGRKHSGNQHTGNQPRDPSLPATVLPTADPSS